MGSSPRDKLRIDEAYNGCKESIFLIDIGLKITRPKIITLNLRKSLYHNKF